MGDLTCCNVMVKFRIMPEIMLYLRQLTDNVASINKHTYFTTSQTGLCSEGLDYYPGTNVYNCIVDNINIVNNTIIHIFYG